MRAHIGQQRVFLERCRCASAAAGGAGKPSVHAGAAWRGDAVTPHPSLGSSPSQRLTCACLCWRWRAPSPARVFLGAPRPGCRPAQWAGMKQCGVTCRGGTTAACKWTTSAWRAHCTGCLHWGQLADAILPRCDWLRAGAAFAVGAAAAAWLQVSCIPQPLGWLMATLNEVVIKWRLQAAPPPDSPVRRASESCSAPPGAAAGRGR